MKLSRVQRTPLFVLLLVVVLIVVSCSTAAQPTAAPAQPTAAPAQPTAAPAEPTTAPAQPTTAPVEPTAAPAEPTAAPVEPTAAPAAAAPTTLKVAWMGTDYKAYQSLEGGIREGKPWRHCRVPIDPLCRRSHSLWHDDSGRQHA